MDSPQSIVSPLKSSSVCAEWENQNANLFGKEINIQGEGETIANLEEDSIGVLEVYIHQARDIHNICIYQKQDVYAKLCLTSNPENTVSTKTINGGGRNPIFNENLRLNVRKVDSSLKCEIWMLSRVRNYLEDQLLGFALVPVSEVLLQNGKREKEFSLSSTDLFHSPAGFVQLSVSFVGPTPDVIPIPPPLTCSVAESLESPISDLDKIEFPDPKVVNENHQMIEEYFGMPCPNLDLQISDSLIASDADNHVISEVGEGLSRDETSSASLSVSSHSSETPKDSKSRKEEESGNGLDCESNRVSSEKPVVTVNIEAEAKVVQQEIVDMYMKSMQEFTESLAKMKLPMDFESGGATSSGNSSPASKNSSGSRVFYGSRAFF